MPKRSKGPTRANRPTATRTSTGTTAQAMEQRVGAFAEQLGRMVGTIQVKAEGWMDYEPLNKQLASVRDGATHLLEQLAASMIPATRTKKKTKKRTVAAARAGNKGRSGGVVDAPGKKHRKQAPADPDATVARSQRAKKRTARTTAKTNRHRARG
jgi:hypothetical protein